MKTLYWSFLLMLLPSMAYTQNTEKENEFTMSMQIRPRAEYRNGALTPRDEGVAPTSFINNRARLSMDYKRSDLELKMSAQHVGVWGQDPQIEKNGRFMLNEAWAKLNFGEGFFAQLGRQSLIYDDERILGGLDWNVAGRYHDALKLGYANKNNEVHLILAFNQNNDNRTSGGTYYDSSTGQPYKNMQTVWYHYKADNVPFGASLLFMNLGLETGDKATDDSHTRYLQTMGTYLTYKNSNWNLDGAFYYQMGKNKAAEKVSALMGSIQAAYTFNQTWGAVASFDYLSGDKGNGSRREKGILGISACHGFRERNLTGHPSGLWRGGYGQPNPQCTALPQTETAAGGGNCGSLYSAGGLAAGKSRKGFPGSLLRSCAVFFFGRHE